jgi:tetratricopeptide (TPR) repeat protein
VVLTERSLHSDATLATVQAELALQEGDVPTAVTRWRLAAQADDASPWIRVRLGEALLLMGDARGAIAAADRAIALCADGKDDALETTHGMAAWRMRSVAQRVLGDDDGAVDSLRTVLAQRPGEPRASALLLQLLVDHDALADAEAVAAAWTTTDGVGGAVTLARAFAERGQHEPALKHLQAALERSPDDDGALDAQRVVLLALGRFDEALEVTRHLVSVRDDDGPFARSQLLTVLALTRVDEARALARTWLADDGSERMHLLVADAFSAAGLLDDAVASLGALTPSTSTLLRLENARLQLDARHPAAAEGACDVRSDDRRLDEYAHLLCAQARADRGDVDTAVEQLLSSGPVISARRLSRAATLLKRATTTTHAPKIEAIVRAQWALHDDATALAALSLQERLEHAAAVAAALSALGAFDDAQALLTSLLTTRPTHRELLLARAKLALEQHPDDVAAAIAPLRMAGARDADVATLNFIAFSLAEANVNSDVAVRSAWQAVLLDPLNGFVLDTLGWALLRANDLDNAAITARRAARLVPTEAEVWWHLAVIEQRRGHVEDAIAAAKQAQVLVLPGDALQTQIAALLTTLVPSTPTTPSP